MRIIKKKNCLPILILKKGEGVRLERAGSPQPVPKELVGHLVEVTWCEGYVFMGPAASVVVRALRDGVKMRVIKYIPLEEGEEEKVFEKSGDIYVDGIVEIYTEEPSSASAALRGGNPDELEAIFSSQKGEEK
jgi:hypothetical protein